MSKEPKKTAALLRWEAEQAARKAGKPLPKPERKPKAAKPERRAAAIVAGGKPRQVPDAIPAAPKYQRTREQELADLSHAKHHKERSKRGPLESAGFAASPATPGHAPSTTGKRGTVAARATIETTPDIKAAGEERRTANAVVPPTPPHRSYNTALGSGARHPRPWRVGGGPDDNILSWIVYDASNHPVISMPFIYSNQQSLRVEAELIVELVNKVKA